MTMDSTTPTRIGMITPSSNTCLEPTTYRLLAGRDDVTVHVARLPVRRIALDEGSDGQFSTEAMAQAARQLADARVDVIVWNGTAGSWLGVAHDRALARLLSDECGVPATTSTLALLEACRVYGVTRLGLATPYTEDVNERVVATYAAQGIEVTARNALGISENEAFARVPVGTVEEQLRAVADDTHAVTVLCTNVHGAALAEPLEAELGIPVLDSVTVTLWHALTLAGIDGGPGFGTLLRDGFLRSRLQSLCEELLEATGADRTTLRLDVPDHDLHVDLTAAEAHRPGVRSIRREGSLDQRRLNTVEWLEANRRNLVQPRFGPPPNPPQALIDVYGVHAQLLGPVEHDGRMPGWFSAHSLEEREWTDKDQAAMDEARTTAEAIVADLLEGS